MGGGLAALGGTAAGFGTAGAAAATVGTAAVGGAAGLGIGEGINRLFGWYGIGDMMRDRRQIQADRTRGEAADIEYQRLRAQTQSLHDQLAAGRTREDILGVTPTEQGGADKIVVKLDELRTAIEGMEVVVELDGRKVGDGIVKARNRG